MLDGSRRHAFQKALMVARTSTILDSVVEVDIRERNISQNFRWVHKIPYLFSPALFTLINAVPAMRQLHTIRLSVIFLPRTCLYGILSSPYLIHLILDAIQMPKISKPPLSLPKLRKLTIMAMYSWEAIEPLISQLVTSLEYLELQGCEFRAPGQLQLPLFPHLRELRYDQSCFGLSDNMTVLNALFHVSQVTHLRLFGYVELLRLDASLKSLQYLSVENAMLTEGVFGTNPFPRLVSLSIRCCQPWGLHYHLTLSSFLRNYFPGITSLRLDIPWSLRNFALLLARSQHSVQALELSIITGYGLDWEERKLRIYEVEIPTDYLHDAVLPAVLQSIRLDVVQIVYRFEESVSVCARWINDNVLHSVTGLGGSDLKCIDVSFDRPEDWIERGQVILKRWIKPPNEDWRLEKYI